MSNVPNLLFFLIIKMAPNLGPSNELRKKIITLIFSWINGYYVLNIRGFFRRRQNPFLFFSSCGSSKLMFWCITEIGGLYTITITINPIRRKYVLSKFFFFICSDIVASLHKANWELYIFLTKVDYLFDVWLFSKRQL